MSSSRPPRPSPDRDTARTFSLTIPSACIRHAQYKARGRQGPCPFRSAAAHCEIAPVDGHVRRRTPLPQHAAETGMRVR